MEHHKLLEVKDLRVTFFTSAGEVKAVGGVSFDMQQGEILGIVGESGSGKSVTACSLLGLVQSPGRVTGGSVFFEGEDVCAFNRRELEHLRGNKASMIFQNPMSSLNPVFTIGNQLTEALTAHDRTVSGQEAARRATEMLRLVGLVDAEHCMKRYPHEFSGGMLQRVMIAMALICSPRLLIADEPTTALDVTIQAQILELLKELRDKTGMAILFITHNLSAVAEICDRVCVMYGGKIVEQGAADTIFLSPGHPYTIGLLGSIFRADTRQRGRLPSIPGAPAQLLNPSGGCPFAPRCLSCMRICLQRMPPNTELAGNHSAACWLRVRERLNDAETALQTKPEEGGKR